MNNDQFNAVTQLTSGINIEYKNFIDKIENEFDSAKSLIILKSDDPKIDGLAINNKLEEIRQHLEGELDTAIEKYQDLLKKL